MVKTEPYAIRFTREVSQDKTLGTKKTAIKLATFPSRYVQGPGAIHELGKHIVTLFAGKVNKAFLIGGKHSLEAVRSAALESLSLEGISVVVEQYAGDSSDVEIERLVNLARKEKADVILGAGGGRAIDTAFSVAAYTGNPMVSIPTIPTTDAPCSRCGIHYDADGNYKTFFIRPKNKDLVIVDTEIIAKAPVRHMVAGIGGVLSIPMEAETALRAGVKGFYEEGMPTLIATVLGRIMFDNLMKYGMAAKLAVEKNVVTPALEIVTETIILFSQIVFEGCGIAGARGFYHGFRVLPEQKRFLEGEISAFGTLMQMVLENREIEEINKIIEFMHKLGLPITLSQLGVEDPKKVELIADGAISVGSTRNVPYYVTKQMAYDAIIYADFLSQRYLETHQKGP